MLKESERRIGEHVYRVTQLPVPEGVKVSVKLIRVMGPALAELMRGARKSPADADMSVSPDGLAGAVDALVTNLTAEDLDSLCHTFARRTLVVMDSGKAPTLESLWELHFAGAYDELVKWLAFSVEVNFKSFFGAAGSLSKLARPEGTEPA